MNFSNSYCADLVGIMCPSERTHSISVTCANARRASKGTGECEYAP